MTTTNWLVASSASAWWQAGTRIGDWLDSWLKKRTSRRYMLSTVDVNTAASSMAGSFTTTVPGQSAPFRWRR